MRYLLCLLVIFSWLPCVAEGIHFSQPSAETADAFTLTSYVNLFLEKSPGLQKEKNDFAIAKNSYQESFITNFLPSFSVSADANKTYIRRNSMSSWDDYHNVTSSASASGHWNVFNGGKDYLSYRSAVIDYKMAQVSFDESLQNKILEAVTTYYNLLSSEKLLAVHQDDLKEVERQYKRDEKDYELGLKTRTDLLASQTNFRSSQMSLLDAQNAYNSALAHFNLAVDRPLQAPVKLDDALHDIDSQLPSLEEDIAFAFENRYDARLQKFALEKADITLLLNRLNTLPSVYVNVFASTSRGLTSHELWGYNYGVSAGIRFDLGFLYLDKYRSRQSAKMSWKNTQLSFEEFSRNVRENVLEQRNALAVKLKSFEISLLRVQAAEQRFENTQIKYNNGVTGVTATDLTQARQEMVSAQINHAQLTTEILTAQLRYRYALGMPLEPVLEEYK